MAEAWGSALSKRVVALMMLVALVDSYDQTALAFAAPSLVREWGIDRSAMGPIFSAQMLGLMIGGVAFGFIGDRLGRKTAIISGMLLFGLLSLATLAASGTGELLIIRFFVGVGVGGVIPNAIAMANEFSPKRYQVTAVAMMFVGYVCGGVGGGMVSAWLIPSFGWEVVFLVGGIVPLLVTALLVFALPESIRFLAASSNPDSRRRAARLAAQMQSELVTGADTLPLREDFSTSNAWREIFTHRLRGMTLLLWLLYIANSTTAFALISWMPILLESIGFTGQVSAVATALLFAGAAVGGVVMGRFVDRVGLGPITLIPAIGIPFVAGVGLLGGSAPVVLYLVTATIGFLVFGFQNSLHGIGGSIYPTPVRAMGVGWALGAGKIGGILGPFIGGVMLAHGATSQHLFVAAAVPLLLSVAAVVLLKGAYNSKIHGGRTSVRPAAISGDG